MEEEIIEQLEELSHYCALKNIDREDNKFGKFVVAIQKTENLIQKQQEELEKLRNKNKDLLRKLRNRVKEVNKLIKYSAYKKEFSRLNTMLEQKNRQIDLMAEELSGFNHLNICDDCEKICEDDYKYTDCNNCIKQYFAEQGKEEE